MRVNVRVEEPGGHYFPLSVPLPTSRPTSHFPFPRNLEPGNSACRAPSIEMRWPMLQVFKKSLSALCNRNVIHACVVAICRSQVDGFCGGSQTDDKMGAIEATRVSTGAGHRTALHQVPHAFRMVSSRSFFRVVVSMLQDPQDMRKQNSRPKPARARSLPKHARPRFLPETCSSKIPTNGLEQDIPAHKSTHTCVIDVR